MISLRPLDRGTNILNKEITSYIVYVYEVCTEKFIWHVVAQIKSFTTN